MHFIDISRTLQRAPKYPTAPETVIDRVDRIANGCDSNFSLMTTNTHAGTHADAQCHFVDGGKGIGEMDLNLYFGPCRVITFPEKTVLSKRDFEGKVEGTERIVIHGGGFTYLDASAAQYLADSGVRTVVTDAWSPAPLDNEKQIHRLLLLAGIAVVENVALEGVPDGEYTLIAFPANYGECDGSPVRAVLTKEL